MGFMHSVVVVGCFATVALAQVVPVGFVVDTLANLGTLRPNDCCFLPDGRCLVANHVGNITVVAGTTTATVGVVPNVQFGGELGLLSIAADPQFATNGWIYVYYSDTIDAFMHLDRFACTGDLANPASVNLALDTTSRRVVLDAIPDTAINHNGGSVRFGPDGKLYLSIGEDSWHCTAQSVASQGGCVVRMDVSGLPAGGSTSAPTYASLDPGDNPLSSANDFSQLVIAFGLRNPFRMEIDPLTGNLYLGDVGHDLVEEYSEYVYDPIWSRTTATPRLRLVNYGWPWREGNIAGPFTCAGTSPPDLVEPIATMQHGGGQASLIGGARYRNLGGQYDFGAMYEGDAFYLDYYTAQVRRLRRTTSWQAAPTVPGQPNAADWATGFLNATCLRLGPDGALWFTQHFPGRLRRVRPDLPRPSIAVVSGSGQQGPAGEPFPQPLVVRVQDALGAPVAATPVHFHVTGGGALSTANPLLTDGLGQASTTLTATPEGGAITVTATAAGALVHTSLDAFARKVTAARAGAHFVVTVLNRTNAPLPQVPYVVLMSFPGSPTLPTAFGPLCIDPAYPFAIVLEDAIGAFNFVSLSGLGGVGAPHLSRLYLLPPGLLTGNFMRFQAVGLDPLSGWFRTDCGGLQF